MESRLEKIFSMGINIMSLAVWLGEDRKCSAAVVGLDLLLGLSMVRRCSLNRSFKRRLGETKRDSIRKAREAFLIKKGRTIDPDGLNIREETY